LNLFSDINFYVTNIKGKEVFLELEIIEVPELNKVVLNGLKKKKDRKKVIDDNKLKAGTKVTENFLANTKRKIQKDFRSDGFYNSTVSLKTVEVPDTSNNNKVNKVNLIVDIDKGSKV